VANLDLARAAPTAANVTVKAPRDYLTEREVEKLMDAARENRWGHRDATAILLAFRHGLRASELVGLRWDDIDWQTSTLHVRRSKGGIGTRQPLAARELRALRRLQREASGVHIFVSERGAPLSVAGYQRMVARAGEAARFPFPIHSHKLRHSCGYKLANDGHDTQFSTISVTARLPRPCATQRCRRTGSEGSGRIDMAAKRLRAASTRLARALFWLGRSSDSPDTGKANPRDSGDSWKAFARSPARFGVNPGTGSGSAALSTG
jgi:integrase